MSILLQDGQARGILEDLSPNCRYALFDRKGGTSAGPFASFNTSYGVGDAVTSVGSNRKRVKEIFGIDVLVSARQVHGDRIFYLDRKPESDCEVDGYDAILTNIQGVGIMIQHADCQAVLLFDPTRRVIGAVHSGWRGSVQNILGKTVKAMTKMYRSKPEDVLAVVSPSLGPCCSEFVNHEQELPFEFRSFSVRENHFDFWQISQSQLEEAGLLSSSIAISGVCTSCSEDYFSYRRSKRLGDESTGRNCSVIVLGEEREIDED